MMALEDLEQSLLFMAVGEGHYILNPGRQP